MFSAQAILLICALVCWVFAAIGRPVPAPYQVGWLGMVFWGVSMLVR
jgi:hypothetical protein